MIFDGGRGADLASIFHRADAEFFVSDPRVLGQSHPATAALASGGFVTVWVNEPYDGDANPKIVAQIADDRGKPLRMVSIAADPRNFNDEPTVHSLGDNGFVVCWVQSGPADGGYQSSLRAQVFGINGEKLGEELVVSEAAGTGFSSPNVSALNSDRFVITWSNYDPSGKDYTQPDIKARIFEATGASHGGTISVNTTTRLGQEAPVVCSLPNGGFVVAWNDGSGESSAGRDSVRMRLFAPSGEPLGPEKLIGAGSYQANVQPNLTALADGNYVVCWLAMDEAYSQERSLKVQVFNPNGEAIGGTQHVESIRGDYQFTPTVTELSTGGFVVSWVEIVQNDDFNSRDIHAQVFSSSGAIEGNQFLVNDQTRGTQTSVVLAGLTDGGFIATWIDDGRVKAQLFEPTQTLAGDITLTKASVREDLATGSVAAVLSIHGPANDVIDYEIVSDPTGGAFEIDGNKLTVRDSYRLDHETLEVVELVVQARGVNGTLIQQTVDINVEQAQNEHRFVLSDEITVNATTAEEQRDPQIVALKHGGFVVTWVDYSNQQGAQDGPYQGVYVRFQAFDEAGQKVGRESFVEKPYYGDQLEQSVAALDDGGFAITWHDRSFGSINLVRFDANGAPAGHMLRLPLNYFDYAREQPSVTQLSSGDILLTWVVENYDENGEYYQALRGAILNSEATLVKDEVALIQPSASGYGVGQIVAVSTGGFLVTWSGSNHDGSSENLFWGQLYDNNAENVGAPMLLGGSEPGLQTQFDIAGLSNDQVLVTWVDGSAPQSDPNRYDVKGQIYSVSGEKQGDVISVNEITFAVQGQPNAVALPSGGFAVTWADQENGEEHIGNRDDQNVNLQIFDATGQKIGGQVAISKSAIGYQESPVAAALHSGSVAVAWFDATLRSGVLHNAEIKLRIIADAPPHAAPSGVDSSIDVQGHQVVLSSETFLMNDADRDKFSGVILTTLPEFGTLELKGAAVVAGQFIAAESILRDDLTYRLDITNSAQNQDSLGFQVVDDGGANDGANVDLSPNRVVFSFKSPDQPASGLVEISGVPEEGGHLLANVVSAEDADGISSIHYQWQVSNFEQWADLADQASSEFFIPSDESFVGKAVRVVTTVVDLLGRETKLFGAVQEIRNVNDAPLGLAFQNVGVAENAAKGTPAGRVLGTDIDSGDKLSYSLVSDAGGRFSVDVASGELTVLNGAVSDYEAARSHEVTVRITDLSGATYDEKVTIQLTNVVETQTKSLTSSADTFEASSDDNWIVNGLAGNDKITTLSGNDVVRGNAGDDTISTDAGDDIITFFQNKEGLDSVDGGAGTDRINALANSTVIGLRSITGVEVISANGYTGVSIAGSTAADTLSFADTTLVGITKIDGGSDNDVITGSAGDDVIVGGSGNDDLTGGGGDDRFTVATSAGTDAYTGGQGQDSVVASASKVVIGISSLTGVEGISSGGFNSVTVATTAGNDKLDLTDVVLTGITNINLGTGNDTILGSSGADYIIGGAGDDTLNGGGGDDTFEIGPGAGSDIIDGGAGVDRIRVTTSSFTWANITGVEALSGASLKLNGTSGDDRLDFSSVTLTGVSKVYAGAGNDVVIGSAGADVIELSAGCDVLTGGAGADVFDLDSIVESKIGALADLITDFQQGVDKISLTEVDASTKKSGNQAFAFVGELAFTGVAGQLRFTHLDSGSTSVMGDLDGDKIADFQIDLVNYLTLSANDFLL